MRDQDTPDIYQYHLARTLKGLQDDFDKARSVAQRVKISDAIDRLLDTKRALEYAREFAKHDRWET